MSYSRQSTTLALAFTRGPVVNTGEGLVVDPTVHIHIEFPKGWCVWSLSSGSAVTLRMIFIFHSVSYPDTVRQALGPAPLGEMEDPCKWAWFKGSWTVLTLPLELTDYCSVLKLLICFSSYICIISDILELLSTWQNLLLCIIFLLCLNFFFQ